MNSKPFEIVRTLLPGEGSPELFEKLYRNVRLMSRMAILGGGERAVVFYSGQSSDIAADISFAVQRKAAWLGLDAPLVMDVAPVDPYYAQGQMEMLHWGSEAEPLHI